MEIFLIFLPKMLFLFPLFIFPIVQIFVFINKKDFISSISLLVQSVLFLLFSFLTHNAVQSDALGILVVFPFCLVLGICFGLQFILKKSTKKSTVINIAITIAITSIPCLAIGIFFCLSLVFSNPWGYIAEQAKSERLLNKTYVRGLNNPSEREEIFFWLVQNWNTPKDILEKIADSQYSQRIAIYMMQHPNTSNELFCKIYADGERTNPSLARKVAQEKNIQCK